MSLDVVRYAVGVGMSPGKSVIFPPTVSQVQCVSDFCCRISAKILPYVNVLPDYTSYLGIKKLAMVPGAVPPPLLSLFGPFCLQTNFT